LKKAHFGLSIKPLHPFWKAFLILQTCFKIQPPKPMLATEKYEIIRSAIIHRLENNLAANLFYHNAAHTIDVEKQAERIATAENIGSAEDIFLLKVAGLYHDSGFLFTYDHHEEAGCDLVKKELPAFGLDYSQIDIVCGLIMATRIPQTPVCRLQEIICDADLDYLGRPDFLGISNRLFLELQVRGYVASKNDWNLIQMNFFMQHTYFTATDKQLRDPLKQQHLQEIISMIETGA